MLRINYFRLFAYAIPLSYLTKLEFGLLGNLDSFIAVVSEQREPPDCSASKS